MQKKKKSLFSIYKTWQHDVHGSEWYKREITFAFRCWIFCCFI